MNDALPTPGPQGPLHGQVALVTGASRGIGAAVARALGDAGAAVAVNYVRDAEAAQAVATSLPRASIWRADVGDRLQVDAMVNGVVEQHGRLDVLVVNAGTWRGGRIEDLSDASWRTVIDTSLTGAYNLMRAAVPVLRRAGGGRVVVMSSAVGLVGFPGDGAYAAAKAGLIGLVRSVAKELGRDGVTVNAVAPGFVETDMTAQVSDASREQMLRRTALRRAGTPEEVAGAVRFLACDGGYVTGHTLVVDGGFSL